MAARKKGRKTVFQERIAEPLPIDINQDFDAQFEIYLQRAGLRPRTAQLYLDKYRQAARALNGNPKNNVDMRPWAAEFITADMPAGTRATIESAVKHYANFVGVDYIRPALRVKAERKFREALTDDQYKRYIEVVRGAGWLPDDVRTVMLLLPNTGLRVQEAVSIRREDLITRGSRLGVRVAAAAKGGKERWIPLNEDASAAVLARLRGASKEIAATGWLFPSKKTNGPVSTAYVQDYFRMLREQLPDLPELTAHVLRHTFATRLLAAGVDLKQVQTLLGHADIAMTSRYLHPSAATLGSAVAKLDSVS